MLNRLMDSDPVPDTVILSGTGERKLILALQMKHAAGATKLRRAGPEHNGLQQLTEKVREGGPFLSSGHLDGCCRSVLQVPKSVNSAEKGHRLRAPKHPKIRPDKVHQPWCKG